MRTLSDIERSWSSFRALRSLSELRTEIRRHESTSTHLLRSVCWKAFLLFETLKKESWSSVLEESRSIYTTLRRNFFIGIDHPEELESSIDPLSDMKESPWNSLRQDEALRAEIYKDVERCLPENLYFRQPTVQKMLLDILFVFCKLNPQLGYKQGMHEVLALVLWVIEQDAVEDLEVGRVSEDKERAGLLRALLDSNFIEHDAFTIFGLVMQNAKVFYESGNESVVANKHRRSSSVQHENDTPIIVRSRRIFEEYLMIVDPGLALHLKDIEVAPQIFLIKWIRLLFGREFPFDDVLRIWDLLFAEDPSLDLVDLICVAMLLRVRWKLIEADINTAFTLLLRYTHSTDSHSSQTFVEDALYLKNNLSLEGGNFLITKYSQRTPLPVNIEDARPSTPKNRRPMSPQRARSPQYSLDKVYPSPNSLELLFQDAARGVLARGERLGIGKAVMEAVNEVKRNVPTMPSLRSPPRPPVAERVMVRSSNIELLERIAQLEQRNKVLASMLEDAVTDLSTRKGAKTAIKSDEEDLEKSLNLVVSKIQCVQDFLADSSIPLPIDNIIQANPMNESVRPSGLSQMAAEDDAAKSLIGAPSAQLENSSSMPVTSVDVQSTRFDSDEAENSPLQTPATSQKPETIHKAARPSRSSLAQSSFSWMLHQDDEGVGSPFTSSPFTGEVRRSRGEKGFLFGEEDTGGKGI